MFFLLNDNKRDGKCGEQRWVIDGGELQKKKKTEWNKRVVARKKLSRRKKTFAKVTKINADEPS